MRVGVVGCGYVGLVSAVGLATIGHETIGVEIDSERRESLDHGVPPFHEPGLEAALATARANGSFRVSGSIGDVAAADVILLCVQTPPTPSGRIELRFVSEAAAALADALAAAPPRRRVVAVRSTVPPGTNETLVTPALAKVPNAAVASNPEFLREGSALDDFLHADRIVVGVSEPWAAQTMRELYAAIPAPVIVAAPATAELAKYASNALLATLVSFSNELARICEATPGVDVAEVLGIIHRDRRLSAGSGDAARPAEIVSYLRAGCGYGGSCLPKDLSALIAYAIAAGEQTPLLEAVAAVNEEQPVRLVDLADQALTGVRGKRVAVLGAAFKAGTDDVQRRGASVAVYDPLVSRALLTTLLPEGVEVAATLEEAIAGASACLVTTIEPEFARLEGLVQSLDGNAPLVVDGRRFLVPSSFPDAGYVAVGRGRTA